MKKFKFLFAGFLISVLGSTSYAQPGTLDSDFDADGVLTTDFGHGTDGAYEVIVQPDGKILVGGFADGSNGDTEYALARYNPDGSFDLTFSFDGKVNTDLGPSSDYGTAMALQNDGKMVLAGYSHDVGVESISLARYNANGSLDLGFNGTGKIITNLFPGVSRTGAIVIQPDGKIVLGGYMTTGANNLNFILMRFQTNGLPDSTFGWTGSVTMDLGSNVEKLNDLALQADGKIVAVGYTFNGAKPVFAVARFLPNGNPDSTFSVDGKLIDGFNGLGDIAHAVTIQPDGKILVVGEAGHTAFNAMAMIRYETNGGYDPAFGIGGKVDTLWGANNSRVSAVKLQVDGKILLAGDATNSTAADLMLARFTAAGLPDPTFGTNGLVTTDLAGGYDYVNGLDVQTDGRIVVAGWGDGGNDDDFLLARYLNGPEVGRVDFQELNNSMLIYPNPIGGNTKLKFSLETEEMISVSLLDLRGQAISKLISDKWFSTGENEIQLNFPEPLGSGIYLLEMKSQTGRFYLRVQK